MQSMPHLTRLTTYSEFFNEALLILICYHFVLFTDLVPDPKTVTKIGSSMVYCLGALLLFNISVMLWINAVNALRNFKLWRLARKQKELIKEAQIKACLKKKKSLKIK
jgi:hypothetical protein